MVVVDLVVEGVGAVGWCLGSGESVGMVVGGDAGWM